MKSIICIRIYSFVIAGILLNMLIASNSKLKAMSSANVSIAGPASLNFKGKVVLDKDRRGIVINSADGPQVLHLVGERLDNEMSLIDYRLMRSCSFDIKFTNEDQTNLLIGFSPMSMENRKKNDKFDMNVEIFDYHRFLPLQMPHPSENRIKAYLKNQCEQRKRIIENSKKSFSDTVEQYHSAVKELASINKQLHIQTLEVDNLKSAITDTENQITDVNYLTNSYELQLKSIKSLITGATKLIASESKKKEQQAKLIKQLQEQIMTHVDNMKIKEDTLSKTRESYSEAMEKSKDVENLVISFQRDLAEIENSISNAKSTSLRIGFDLKAANDQKKQNEKSVKEINSQVEVYNAQRKEYQETLQKKSSEKNSMENSISQEKEDIKKIEQKINELILQKSKKEEALQMKYEEVKAKEEEISRVKIENESLSTKMKRLNEKKERVENVENKETILKIENLSKELLDIESQKEILLKKSQKLNETLNESIQKKDGINSKIIAINSEIKIATGEIDAIKKIKSSLEKSKADIATEIKDKEEKLTNLESDSRNYSTDIENVKKSLKSVKLNSETFSSILNDFKAKLGPVEEKFNEYMKKKMSTEARVKTSIQKIKDAARDLKNQAKSATVMIDLAEDEAFNIDEDSISAEVENKEVMRKSLEGSIPKYQSLIDKIIN